MRLPFRLPMAACIHPETYKYFLAPEVVDASWAALGAAFGEVRTILGVGVRQIDGLSLIIRSVLAGNPITVIRTARCTPRDLAQLHAILGFEESS